TGVQTCALPIFRWQKAKILYIESTKSAHGFIRSAPQMANPISTTAYYTLGARAWDASRLKPVCGDSFAKYFMNEEADAVWQKFKGYTMPNISNASRHAMIDNYLREVLQSTPDATVVIIGA